ncbi:MAG: biotin/lipoyl-binding protein [Desulfurococcus sp.]|nr:biotin/lipoyl-binding protein [Desulfurococcus sp.]
MPKKYTVTLVNNDNVDLEVLAREKDLVVLRDSEGRIYRVRILKESDGRYILFVDDKPVSVGIVGKRIYVNLESIFVRKIKEKAEQAKIEKEVEKTKSIELEVEEEGVIKTPVSGRVADVRVTPGQSVNEGDVIAVLESMKMFIEVKSPYRGVVEAVYVKPGGSVSKDGRLVKIKVEKSRG